jgi:hypothetical protein
MDFNKQKSKLRVNISVLVFGNKSDRNKLENWLLSY